MEGGVEGQEQLRTDLAALRRNRDAASTRQKARRQRRRWPWLVLLLALAAGGGALWLLRAQPVRTTHASVSAEAANQPVSVLSGAGYLVPGDRVVSVGARVPGRV